MSAFHRVALGLGVLALSSTLAHAADPAFRLYADEFPRDPASPLRPILPSVEPAQGDPTVPMATVTTQGYANGTEIVNGIDPACGAGMFGYWDFTPTRTQGIDVIQRIVPVTDPWTCYLPTDGGCGFALAGNDFMLRTDTPSTGSIDVAPVDFDGSSTFYLRAQVFNEGTPDEFRLCFDPPEHPDVPFVVFPNPDGARQFLQAGDPQF